MTEGPLEPEDLAPEDDWSFEAESQPGSPWAWIDDAVGAWDESAVADSVPAEDLADVDGIDHSDEDESDPAESGDSPVESPTAPGELHLGPVELEASDDFGEPDEEGLEDLDVSEVTPGAGVGDDLIGSCPVTSLVDTLALVGVDDAGSIFSALDSDHLGVREAVGALDFAGVPARVEYTDLGDLLEQLASGVDVVLGGGEPHAVVAIDPQAGEVVVEPLAGGDRTALAMDAFEAAWEETANEVMVVNSDSSGIQLGADQIWVLPLGVAAMMGDD